MTDLFRVVFLCVGLCALVRPAAGANNPTPLTVLGNSDHAWVYRFAPATSIGSTTVTFAYGQTLDTGLRFRIFHGDPFGGNVVTSALRSENLHIFFRDGSHYRLRYVARGLSTPPRDDCFRELTAPGDIAPAAVHGDSDANAVFAIVSTEAAKTLPLHVQPATDPAPTPNEGDDATEDAVPLVTAETLVNSTIPLPRLSIVRYYRGNWEFVTLCPLAMNDAGAMWLSTHKNTYAILYGLKNSPEVLTLQLSSNDGWNAQSNTPPLSADNVQGFFSDAGVFTMIAKNPDDKASSVHLQPYKLLDGVWKPGTPFGLKGSPTLSFEGQVSVSPYAGELAIAYEKTAEDKTDVFVGLWPMKGGSPIENPAEVGALGSGANSDSSNQTAALVIAGLLSLLLFIVFVRRTPSLFTELEVPDGYVLTGSGKRLLAFLLDVLVVMLVAFPLVVTPWIRATFDAGDNVQQELAYLFEYDPNAAFAPWIKSLLLLMVYATVMEIWFKATLGKLVLGLRVCTTQGRDASAWSIIVRNALRFELYYKLAFLPLAMLVLLTRNHQRLGDLVAGTLVIEKQSNESKV